MGKSIQIFIAFDPRDLWFQAGFEDIRAQAPQWSQELNSADRALERFLNDDCFTDLTVNVQGLIDSNTKVIIGLDQKAKTSLEETALAHNLSLLDWLIKRVGTNQVEIRLYNPG